MSFHHADFHETCNKRVNFYVNFVYWMYSKSDEKYRKYGLDFIYLIKERTLFTTPVFRKFTNA
jgi:hypothetical protein